MHLKIGRSTLAEVEKSPESIGGAIGSIRLVSGWKSSMYTHLMSATDVSYKDTFELRRNGQRPHHPKFNRIRSHAPRREMLFVDELSVGGYIVHSERTLEFDVASVLILGPVSVA